MRSISVGYVTNSSSYVEVVIFQKEQELNFTDEELEELCAIADLFEKQFCINFESFKALFDELQKLEPGTYCLEVWRGDDFNPKAIITQAIVRALVSRNYLRELFKITCDNGPNEFLTRLDSSETSLLEKYSVPQDREQEKLRSL
ncbi:MAG: hypothetical protein DRG33_06180 [Deltaproteobacteria bacterium]|nr:MAG: hypothetical protein DRG33_06180 [Deltaproteobacteria bacterium]